MNSFLKCVSVVLKFLSVVMLLRLLMCWLIYVWLLLVSVSVFLRCGLMVISGCGVGIGRGSGSGV